MNAPLTCQATLLARTVPEETSSGDITVCSAWWAPALGGLIRIYPLDMRAGIVWDEATMTDYNRDPKAKVPGTKMVFNGVKNAGQLADLVAYLKQATQ